MTLLQTVKLGSKKFFIHWHDAYDPAKHPHAPKGTTGEYKPGEFVPTGTGGTTGKSSETPSRKSEPKTSSESPKHPAALVEVGGDEWNKKTAVRLADEFHEAKPELDQIKDKIVKSGPLAEEEEEPDWRLEALAEKKWDNLKDDIRDEVKKDWMESHWDELVQIGKYTEGATGDLSDEKKGELVYSTLNKIWGAMNAAKKYDYASTHHKEVIKQEEKYKNRFLGEPEKYDPLNHPLSDAEDIDKASLNYKKTQSIARKMSLDRAYDLIMKRKVKDTEGWGEQSFQDLRDDIARTDDDLWGAWKASSTSKDGLLIQVAAADELGGRLRGEMNIQPDKHADEYETIKVGSPKAIIEQANLAFAKKNPLIKSAVDKLGNTGYQLDKQTGDHFWFDGYDGSTVVVNSKLTPGGSPMSDTNAWIAYDSQGFPLEKGANMQTLPKFLSKQAHSSKAA